MLAQCFHSLILSLSHSQSPCSPTTPLIVSPYKRDRRQKILRALWKVKHPIVFECTQVRYFHTITCICNFASPNLLSMMIFQNQNMKSMSKFSPSLFLFVSLSFLFARISLDRLEPIKPFLQSIEISINSYSMSIESAIWFNDFQ